MIKNKKKTTNLKKNHNKQAKKQQHKNKSTTWKSHKMLIFARNNLPTKEKKLSYVNFNKDYFSSFKCVC